MPSDEKQSKSTI